MPGIVIHSEQVVYWPIPKNACTSIKTRIAEVIGLTYDNIHEAPFEWTENSIPEYFDFGFVRNPYDRLLSLYNNKAHFTDGIVFRNHAQKFWPEMSFAEFVRAIISIDEDTDPHYDLQCRQLPRDCYVMFLEERHLPSRLSFLLDLDRLNASSQIDHYTHEIKTMVLRHYLPDFIKFGYEF